MKTQFKMRITLFKSIIGITFLLIVLFTFDGISQSLDFKFNHLSSVANIRADSMTVTNVELGVSGSNKFLKLTNNSTIILKNVTDCAQLRFDFSSITTSGNSTVGLSFTKSNVNMNSVFFDQPQITIPNSTEFYQLVITQELVGTHDIKFQMISSDVNEVHIDNISIIRLTESRRKTLEEAAFFARFQNTTNDSEYRDYFTKTSTFTRGNFEALHSLYYKYNTLATFADIHYSLIREQKC